MDTSSGKRAGRRPKDENGPNRRFVCPNARLWKIVYQPKRSALPRQQRWLPERYESCVSLLQGLCLLSPFGTFLDSLKNLLYFTVLGQEAMAESDSIQDRPGFYRLCEWKNCNRYDPYSTSLLVRCLPRCHAC